MVKLFAYPLFLLVRFIDAIFQQVHDWMNENVND